MRYITKSTFKNEFLKDRMKIVLQHYLQYLRCKSPISTNTHHIYFFTCLLYCTRGCRWSSAAERCSVSTV